MGSGPGGVEEPIVLGPDVLIHLEGRTETLVRIPSLAESDADNEAIILDGGVHSLHSDAVGPVASMRAMFRKNAVDAVTLHREDGMSVKAKTSDGTFVAWWPSQHSVRAAVALDDDGAELATVTPRAGQTGFVTP